MYIVQLSIPLITVIPITIAPSYQICITLSSVLPIICCCMVWDGGTWDWVFLQCVLKTDFQTNQTNTAAQITLLYLGRFGDKNKIVLTFGRKKNGTFGWRWYCQCVIRWKPPSLPPSCNSCLVICCVTSVKINENWILLHGITYFLNLLTIISNIWFR